MVWPSWTCKIVSSWRWCKLKMSGALCRRATMPLILMSAWIYDSRYVQWHWIAIRHPSECSEKSNKPAWRASRSEQTHNSCRTKKFKTPHLASKQRGVINAPRTLWSFWEVYLPLWGFCEGWEKFSKREVRFYRRRWNRNLMCLFCTGEISDLIWLRRAEPFSRKWWLDLWFVPTSAYSKNTPTVWSICTLLRVLSMHLLICAMLVLWSKLMMVFCSVDERWREVS